MGVFAWFHFHFSRQYEHAFAWFVIFFAVGIGLYFSFRFEPKPEFLILLLSLALLWALAAARYRHLFGLLPMLPVMMFMGYALAGGHAHYHKAPVLQFHYYGPFYGRVIKIDRSSSHATRLTLDQVQLTRMPAHETPKRIRISLHGDQRWLHATPGQFVGGTGHLSAPNGPVEPGGFDFQRHAWFLGLGAVGYTRSPVLEMAASDHALPISETRQQIAGYAATYLGGDIGGFAAAVTTGDRSAFSQEAIEDLRISNLAHLLAISGLHMGLLASFLFGVIRLFLSIWQPLALRVPVKKIAAVSALAVATGYLLLSGASIATQRAYIMAAVALVAVSLDRRVLTLRAVAIAAFIVLLLRPISLLSPGFQMSFAATTALVFVFSFVNQRSKSDNRFWQNTVFALVLSSFVAGIATAPFAAAHFNQWAAYGLLANISAVPAMGLIVIPGAVTAAVLWPLGLDWIGLEIMGLGLRWILFIAHWISSLDGARVPVVTPNAAVLPLISLGGSWLILWQGQLRWAGVGGLLAAVWLWAQTERPDILISSDGKLIGVMTESGRVLSKPRGQGFVAGNWLENDGDPADQATAASRHDTVQSGVLFTVKGHRSIVHYQGKRGAELFENCAREDIIILDQDLNVETTCAAFDGKRLRKTGAIAIWLEANDSLKIQSVADHRGHRLWTPEAHAR